MPTQLPELELRSTWEEYEKIQPLSSGGAGQVFIVKSSKKKENKNNTSNCFYYVLKRIFIDNPETLQQALTEIATMNETPQHINCVKMIDYFRDKDEEYVNIVQEYSCIGDLDRLMKARREQQQQNQKQQQENQSSSSSLLLSSVFSVEEVIFLACQMLIALRHLHSHQILHRDLKPQNLVLDFFWRSTNNNNNSCNDDDDKKNKKNKEDESSSMATAFATAKTKLKESHCYLWNLLHQSEERRLYLLQQKEENNTNSHEKKENTGHEKRKEQPSPEQQQQTYNCSPDGDAVIACSACLCRVPISECVIKVADFGVARTLNDTAAMRNTVLGTPFYLAPELIENAPYTFPVDLWSFGVVLWEICASRSGERLFGGENMLAVVMSITSCRMRQFDDDRLNRRVLPIIESVIRADPKERLTAEELLKKFF